jgi:hypothetical protein
VATNFQITVANVLARKGLDLDVELLRMQGEGLSAASMALELVRLSDGVVSITGPTVATWADALLEKAS